MPTKRRRHAVTETAPVAAALEALKLEMGNEPIELSELVVLGAEAKIARLRSQRDATAARRRRLAAQVRTRSLPVDPAAAAEVRRSGWTRT